MSVALFCWLALYSMGKPSEYVICGLEQLTINLCIGTSTLKETLSRP